MKVIRSTICSLKFSTESKKFQLRAILKEYGQVVNYFIERFWLETPKKNALKKLNFNTKVKRRLTKNIRRSLGIWTYRYWLNRLEMLCEDNRVALRRVYPAYTSQRCNQCEHTERANRSNTVFLCRKCHHTDDADVNAAKNILGRWAGGPYGAAYKLEKLDVLATGKIVRV